MQSKKEIEQELELAGLMVADLEKLWKSYAKKAFAARQERETKKAKKGFMDCETREELIELFGYGTIDEDTYHRGLEYFDAPEKTELSVIELHRNKIKQMLDSWRGTVKELNEELNPTVKDTENVFDKMARAEREERYRSMM